MLVFVWAADTLLRGSAREKVIDSAVGRFPVIGNSLNQGHLGGGAMAVTVGVVGALWAGTKAFEAFELAMTTVWHGPLTMPTKFFPRKLRAVAMIVAFGLGLVVATAGSAVVATLQQIPAAARPLGILASILFNALLAGMMFSFSVSPRPPWRHLVPGAVVTGVLMTLLYSVGTVYLTRVIANAGDTYGTFAIVIGLLTWLNLICTVVVWSAELNSVLAGRRAAPV